MPRIGGSPARAGIGPRACPGPRRGGWLPRASGDRPWVGPPVVVVGAAPPRERGSARDRRAARRRERGSPARAGIGPLDRSLELGVPGLPRASGDRPVLDADEGTFQAPPRERGSARGGLPWRHSYSGSPARAGIGPPPTRRRPSSPWLPRVSGDRPIGGNVFESFDAAPPRERGSAPPADGGDRRRRGSPARAGIGPCRGTCRRGRSRLPRASGDRPNLTQQLFIAIEAPPRERGSARRDVHASVCRRGSPARAGIGPGLQNAGVYRAPPRERGLARRPGG